MLVESRSRQGSVILLSSKCGGVNIALMSCISEVVVVLAEDASEVPRRSSDLAVRCVHAVVQVVAIVLPDAAGGRAHHRPPASATVLS